MLLGGILIVLTAANAMAICDVEFDLGERETHSFAKLGLSDKCCVIK